MIVISNDLAFRRLTNRESAMAGGYSFKNEIVQSRGCNWEVFLPYTEQDVGMAVNINSC